MVPNNGRSPQRSILIVDDDPSIRYMLCRVLLGEGYDVVSAANGRDGMEIMAAREIDLVLLDWKMPGLNGEDTLKEISILHPALPVIMITAYPRKQSEGGLIRASAVLQKPLDFPMLLEAIKKLLSQAPACE
jgi:DNA-binding response OmpR family regulator